MLILAYQAYLRYRKNKVLGATNIIPVDKQNLIFPINQDFKYYFELQPGIKAQEKLFWTKDSYISYSYNQDGLNERYDYNTFKPNNYFRIITLGDSFTYGHFVETKYNWTEILEDLLNNNSVCSTINKFEVINLGMPGFDIPYIVKRYNDKGMKYHPDLIIWFESGSGFDRNNEIAQPYIQECETKSTADYSKIVPSEEFYKCWNNAYKMLNEENLQEGLDEWVSIFMKLRDNTPTVFAVFKNIGQENRNILDFRIENQPNAFLMDEITDIYSKQGTLPEGHPNQKGHEIIANDIYRYLVSNKEVLLKCH